MNGVLLAILMLYPRPQMGIDFQSSISVPEIRMPAGVSAYLTAEPLEPFEVTIDWDYVRKHPEIWPEWMEDRHAPTH